MKNWQRVTICVMLIVSVLTMSLSVFADDSDSDEEEFLEWYNQYASEYPNPDDMWQATGVYGIWLVLNGMGIRVSADAIYEWADETYLVMEDLIFQYLLEMIPGSNITKWFLPWLWGWTSTGDFQGNNTMLEDVQDFAKWIKNHFGLNNNSSVIINGVTVIPALNAEGIPIYIPVSMDFGTSTGWYPIFDGDTDIFAETTGFVTNYPYQLASGYYVRFYDNGSTVRMQASRSSEFSGLSLDKLIIDAYTYPNFVKTRAQVSANQGYNGHNEIPIFYNSNVGDSYKFKLILTCYYNQSVDKTYGNVFVPLTVTEVQNYLAPQEIGPQVETGIIEFPDDDPTYTDGDMVIVQDGENVYISVEFPDSIAVNNLPAIVSSTSIDNPHLEEAYRPIQGLIEYAKDGISVCTALLYELPDEMVYMWYGVIGSIIIWGMIKLMREH